MEISTEPNPWSLGETQGISVLQNPSHGASYSPVYDEVWRAGSATAATPHLILSLHNE